MSTAESIPDPASVDRGATEDRPSMDERLDTEDATRLRYSAAAQTREAALGCPVDYDRTLLEAVPDEVIERDYGCGDPSRYVAEGQTVLDLGSGHPLVEDASVDLIRLQPNGTASPTRNQGRRLRDQHRDRRLVLLVRSTEFGLPESEQARFLRC